MKRREPPRPRDGDRWPGRERERGSRARPAGPRPGPEGLDEDARSPAAASPPVTPAPASTGDRAGPTVAPPPRAGTGERAGGADRLRAVGRLLEVIRSARERAPALRSLCAAAARALDVDAVVLLDSSTAGASAGGLRLAVAASHGAPARFPTDFDLAPGDRGLVAQALLGGEPATGADLAGREPADAVERALRAAGARAAIAAPLRASDAALAIAAPVEAAPAGDDEPAAATAPDARRARTDPSASAVGRGPFGPARPVVLAFTPDAGRAFDDADRETALVAVDGAALLLEGLALREQATREGAEAVDRERRRFAREVHDGVAQTVGAAALEVERLALVARREGAPGRTPSAADLEALAARLSAAFQELRDLGRALRSRPLPGTGARRAVEMLVTEARRLTPALAVEARLEGLEGRLDPDVEHEVYRIIQEALWNAVRHSGASRVRLDAQKKDGALRLTIEDDGRGFTPPAPGLAPAPDDARAAAPDGPGGARAGHRLPGPHRDRDRGRDRPEAMSVPPAERATRPSAPGGRDEDRGRARGGPARSGLGLVGMKERARLLGGEFRVESRLGRGTVITLEVPLARTRPAR